MKSSRVNNYYYFTKYLNVKVLEADFNILAQYYIPIDISE